MGFRRTKEKPSGVLLDDIIQAAHWVSSTSGYSVKVGVQFSCTESGTLRNPIAVIELLEGSQNGLGGEVVHERHWHYPTDNYKSWEGLLLHLLYQAEMLAEQAA